MKLTKAQEALIVRAGLNGTKIDCIAKRWKVSPSTVDRILSRRRAAGKEIKIKRGRPTRKSVLHDFRAVEVEGNLDPRQIDEICGHLFEEPFPYPEQLSAEKLPEK